MIGAGLLVAAAFAGSAAPSKAGKSEVKRGGTLRVNVSSTDFEYLDPALAYDSIGWQALYAMNMTLLNYPDKPALLARVLPRRRLPASAEDLGERQHVHVHRQERPSASATARR